MIFTPDGTRLISLSHDRTVRIQDVFTGRLKRTLRIQIGDDKAGMIYAGDNSPDGNVFAIGGLMKFDTMDGLAIRLIDLGAGRAGGVLRGHSHVENGLAPPQSRQDRRTDKISLKKRIPIRSVIQ